MLPVVKLIQRVSDVCTLQLVVGSELALSQDGYGRQRALAGVESLLGLP